MSFDRFFDVICDRTQWPLRPGKPKRAKPIVAIYSTFLQRSYDQIFRR